MPLDHAVVVACAIGNWSDGLKSQLAKLSIDDISSPNECATTDLYHVEVGGKSRL